MHPTMMQMVRVNLARAGMVSVSRASTPADSHFILTATGPDRAGIVFDIAKLVLDNNGDIQESRMMRMGCDFSLMMRVAAPKPDADQITQKLGKVGGMSVITHPVTAERANQVVPKPAWKANFNVEGVNHPGLVYKVTELFFARGLRVEKLHTDTKIAPFGGTVLFLMDGTIISDKPIDFADLKEASESLSSFLGIDLDLKPLPTSE
jgi:glycine cleavage system transcriptional repressor